MGVRSDISSSRTQGLSITDGALFVLCLVFSSWCVGERLIARDEGFYTYAAQLILEGKHPYIDFFYPQMPLLPYLYATSGALFGTEKRTKPVTQRWPTAAESVVRSRRFPASTPIRLAPSPHSPASPTVDSDRASGNYP